MIAKRARKSATRSLKRTCMYIADQSNSSDFKNSLTGPKAENIRLTNLHSSSLYDAFLEMEETQALNVRSKSDKNYHLIVSFPVGEKPSEVVLKDIEDNLVRRIGLGDHQRISIVHNDTDHFHFHVLINKVHPQSYNNVEPYYDKKDLMKVCDEMELKHGLIKTNHVQTTSKTLSDSEVFRQEESLKGFIKSNVDSFKRCLSWSELHKSLNELGLQLKRKGAGLVFLDQTEQVAVKASSIDRQFSLKNLEKSLGVFESGDKIYESRSKPNSRDGQSGRRGADEPGGNAGLFRTGSSVFDDYLKRLYKSYDSEFADFSKTESIHNMRSLSSEYMDGNTQESSMFLSNNETSNLQERGTSDDIQRVRRSRKSLSDDGKVKGYDKDRRIKTSVLYGEYKQQLSDFFSSRQKLKIQHKNEKQRFDVAINDLIEAEKKTIKLKTLPNIEKRKLYKAMYLKCSTLKNEFNARQARERSELPVKPSWPEFLKEQVNANNEFSEIALRTLRNQSKKLASKVDSTGTNSTSLFKNFDSKIRLNGTIAYNIANKPAVLDRAKDLKVDNLDEKSVLLAVLIAKEKFNGRALNINGSDEFKRMVVKVINDNSIAVRLKDKKLDDQIYRPKDQIAHTSVNDSKNTNVKKR